MSKIALLKIWGISLVFWTLFLFAITFVAGNTSPNVSYSRVLSLYWYWYVLWGLLSPFILFGTLALKKTKPSALKTTVMHFCGFLVFFLIYVTLGVAFTLAFMGEVRGKTGFLEAVLETIRSNTWIFDFTLYALVVCVSYVLYYIKQVQEKEKQNIELHSKLYKTQLESLRSQLNPHFLFNALNTISGLTRMNKAKAATDALAELSYMLRIVLSEQSSTTTSLENEMIFIKKYVGFQELRFGEKLLVNIDVDDICLEAEVPFLLIHTIVENAIKHGSQLSSYANNVDIIITGDPDSINIRVENQICQNSIDDGFGIGLINCQQRLESYYKDNYKFESKELSDSRYCISITIPNREKVDA
jgi:hypothetical protein